MVVIALTSGEDHSDVSQEISDMTIVAFFYLLQPGEYTFTTNDCTTFRICDMYLWIGNQAVDAVHAQNTQLLASTSASLIFTK
jgi:hypothetical protein